ncbi:hypothetical protein BOO86_13060 [Mycobacterium sp. CBMA 234]|nr:hypothetical protein [Mycolicibacterium sp. CBMA 234]
MHSEAIVVDDDPNYQHPKCYNNLHGRCSTKISGENYISHSPIKLDTFNDSSARLMHDHGFLEIRACSALRAVSTSALRTCGNVVVASALLESSWRKLAGQRLS